MKKTAKAARREAWRRNALVRGAGFAGAMALSAASHANLVVNGGFDDPATPVNVFITQASVFATTSSVPGWFMGGAGAFERVYSPGCADDASTPACGLGGVLHLAGPVPAESAPGNGNFFALDADPTFGGPFGPDSIQQFISVVPGNRYVLSFLYAAGQDKGLTGATMDAWQVSLDGVFLPGDGGTLNTPQPPAGPKNTTTQTLSIPSQGFSGWHTETLQFTAPTPAGYSGSGSALELLTFLGVSPNGGLPPILLLDNVSVNQVPEPGSLALLGVGLASVMTGLRRRR